MKVFLTLQAALIAVTLLLCLHARGLSEDVGITRMDTIEKIHNSNCDYIAVIHDTEELYDRFSQFDSIDVEIKGGFHYETEAEFKERLMNAEDMEIETPSEKLFSLDFGGMNFMVPGKKYLIIAQTLDFKEKTVYRINGYQISWLCLDETESKIMKEEYVYSECCNNEIFSPDHSIIEAFYAKKDDILKTYNIVL